MREKEYRYAHFQSQYAGIAYAYKSRGIRLSGLKQNILGGPYPRPADHIFLVDVPNFVQNRAVRLEELRRWGNGVAGTEIRLQGDGRVWIVQRDYLCAGSNWFRNQFAQSEAGATVSVSVTRDTNKL